MDILVPLTENHEYKRVYARGKSAVRPALVLYCLRNKKGEAGARGHYGQQKRSATRSSGTVRGAFCVKASVRCIRN